MKIIKIGTFDKRGIPTGWHIDLSDQKGTEYCLGIDQIFSGSVDVNGIEIVEWTQARKDLMIER
jgi:hypothetical protein